MPTYAIGDIQGCYRELRKLLDKLHFDPASDKVWLVGDLVNRGPASLKVLRLIRDLGESAVTVLGNHDLHFLALAAGNRKHAKKSTLDDLLKAPDCGELVDWLRSRPMLHHDDKLGFTLIHAGLPPQWDLRQAMSCARELESTLRADDYREFLLTMYGDQPDGWSEDLSGMERLRFITNCLTRLRFCDTAGRLALKEKGEIGSQAPGLVPWFQAPDRKTRENRIIFGHWSQLGYWTGHNVWAIDSGCLWGGALTAIRVDQNAIEPLQLKCKGYLKPGQD